MEGTEEFVVNLSILLRFIEYLNISSKGMTFRKQADNQDLNFFQESTSNLLVPETKITIIQYVSWTVIGLMTSLHVFRNVEH